MNVNLLPWKQDLEKRKCIYVTASLIFIFLLLLTTSFYLKFRLNRIVYELQKIYQASELFLIEQASHAPLKTQFNKTSMNERVMSIFLRITQILPDSCRLVEIERERHHWRIRGSGGNLEIISDFILRLRNDQNFHHVIFNRMTLNRSQPEFLIQFDES